MTNKNSQSGFSVISLIVTILVITGIGLAGYYVWHKNHQQDDKQTTSKSESQSTQKSGDQRQASDPTEGGRYLVIKEWGVRFPLPQDLQERITYQLSEELTDEDGNHLQGAKIFISNPGPDTVCTLEPGTTSINSGAQLIRSEKDKPFDASRYKWTFKENVASDNKYNYHVNYLTPDCASDKPGSETAELQLALEKLSKI